MKIALAGNPNSGKTTMFNALTGSSEKVGNWAGVTVDKKENQVKKSLLTEESKISLVDLPGAYSISPFTSEESITRDYIINEKPDVIINIVDVTNLSRSLFFTTELLELGIPMVVALNKTDLRKKKKTEIDTSLLSELLLCPVFETVSTSSEGIENLLNEAIKLKGAKQEACFTQDKSDKMSKKAMLMADRKRFEFVNNIVKQVEKRKVLTKDKTIHDKIDAVLTNKWLGIPIFAVVMGLVFMISQHEKGPGVIIADYLTGLIESFQSYVGGLLEGVNPLVYALLVDGIIGGVGAVIGFLPLVMIMYFLIALLEDCGYMARVSVVLDPIFKRVGLSGKSVIPFVVGTGCAVPGVMACRTIRNEKERKAAAMLTPFMPCGAKLPVIALFAGAFFEDASWIGTLMYLVGIVIIFFGALIVNAITGNKGRKSYFIMEIPEYKAPSVMRAFASMIERGREYIIKAGTVILLCNTVVQIMQSFTPMLTVSETADASILAYVSHPFAYLLVPVIGYHAWQFAAAAISGFIAKENVVATIAVCFALTNVSEALPGAAPELTSSAALAYLMFNLFTPPCFAAIGAMNAEMKSAAWLWGSVALQLATGYVLSFCVYQVGTLITEGKVGTGFFGGLVAVLAIVLIISFLCVKGSKKAVAKNK